MSKPTVSGYKTLTQDDLAKIRSTATSSRQYSLGASIPLTQREGVLRAYNALSTADKSKLLSALVTVAKNFVIGGASDLKDRKKAGGSTDEGYKRRNTVWGDHVAFVKLFITSATTNGVVPSWDSIILNLQEELKFEIYASFDNLYAPRFMAQTKLASYIDETEFVQIYALRTAAARKLAGMAAHSSWEGATDTYSPILADYANLVSLVRSGDVRTCFMLSAIIDYMARYRYYKTQRNQDLRTKFEQEAVYELTKTAEAFGIVFTGNETRRQARILISDALTKKKQYFVKTGTEYTPFSKKEQTLSDIGIRQTTGLYDFIADVSDKAKPDKPDSGIPMSGTGTSKPVNVKSPDLLDDIKSVFTTSSPTESVKVIPYTPSVRDNLWNAIVSTYEVDGWISDMFIQQPIRGVRYQLDLTDVPTIVPDASMQMNKDNYKGLMKWLSVQTDLTTQAAQRVGQALTKLGLIKHSGMFAGTTMRYNTEGIIQIGGWADITDAKQRKVALDLLNIVDNVFGDSVTMRSKFNDETQLPLGFDQRLSVFTAWTSLDRSFVKDPNLLMKNNHMSMLRRKLSDYIPINDIIEHVKSSKLSRVYS